MTYIESVIDPYRVADDFRRESVSLVSIHRLILAIPASLFVSTVKSVGSGVSERRINFGPKYRIYFASIKKGNVIQIVVLLGGGTKKRQNKDIEIAQERWKDFKDRRRKGEKFWH